MLLKNASPLASKKFQNIHVCGQVSKSVIITLTMFQFFEQNNFLLNSYELTKLLFVTY